MTIIVAGGVQYDLEPAKLEPEPKICTLDGVEYYLGPSASFKMNWFKAMEWCQSLGPDHELPDRQVLLACFCNAVIKTNFGPYGHWSSSEFNENQAWAQYLTVGSQAICNKSGELFVQSVRKQVL